MNRGSNPRGAASIRTRRRATSGDVVKWFNTEVCKTSIHRFESGRRLHIPSTKQPAERSAGFSLAETPERCRSHSVAGDEDAHLRWGHSSLGPEERNATSCVPGNRAPAHPGDAGCGRRSERHPGGCDRSHHRHNGHGGHDDRRRDRSGRGGPERLLRGPGRRARRLVLGHGGDGRLRFVRYERFGLRRRADAVSLDRLGREPDRLRAGTHRRRAPGQRDVLPPRLRRRRVDGNERDDDPPRRGGRSRRRRSASRSTRAAPSTRVASPTSRAPSPARARTVPAFSSMSSATCRRRSAA